MSNARVLVRSVAFGLLLGSLTVDLVLMLDSVRLNLFNALILVVVGFILAATFIVPERRR